MAKKKQSQSHQEPEQDSVELTPEELGQASVSYSGVQSQPSSGKWIAVRNITANKKYKIGDEFPADQVTKQLVDSGAIKQA